MIERNTLENVSVPTVPPVPPKEMYMFGGETENQETWKKNYERYAESKKSFVEALPNIAEESLSRIEIKPRQALQDKHISSLDEVAVTEVIPYIQGPAREEVQNKLARLAEQKFNSGFINEDKIALSMVKVALPEDRIPLIRAEFENPNAKSGLLFALETLETLPSDQRATLSEELLEKNGITNVYFAKLIKYVSPQKRGEYILDCLDKTFPSEQREALYAFAKLPFSERQTLEPAVLPKLKAQLEQFGQVNHFDEAIVDLLSLVHPDDRVQLVKKILSTPKMGDISHLTSAANVIASVPEAERENLNTLLVQVAEKGIRSGGLGLQDDAVSLFKYIPEQNRTALIIEAMKKMNWEKAGVARMENLLNSFKFVPESGRDVFQNELADILRTHIQGSNENLRGLSATMIHFLSEQQKEELENLLPLQVLESALYKKAPEDFFKTRTGSMGAGGDNKIIFGGDARGKFLLRETMPRALIEWSRAFENHNFWKSNGFDYVPIEPILDIKTGRVSGKADVYTGILGPSIWAWLQKNTKFASSIIEQRDKIIAGLEKMGVTHGDYTDNNFCLMFSKNPDGTDDYTKPPRVYCIDFDTAKASELA